MKTFTKQFQARPKAFRGHDFQVNEKTLTLPDAVPTLKEIILSGSAQQVSKPIYDSSYEEGAYRALLQSLPIEQVIGAIEGNDDKDDKRSAKDAKEAPQISSKPASEVADASQTVEGTKSATGATE